ncbi:hypothetical protein BaRGS_00006997, partial [Batillaria attramentaria]
MKVFMVTHALQRHTETMAATVTKPLSFLNWNVDGLLSKLEDGEFVDYVASFDFVCLVEIPKTSIMQPSPSGTCLAKNISINRPGDPIQPVDDSQIGRERARDGGAYFWGPRREKLMRKLGL